MKESSYYFPHDYNPQNDMQMVGFISKNGSFGYGIYWRIVEILHQEKTHKLPMKEYVYLAIAKQMLANAEQVEMIAINVKSAILDCVNIYELFKSDGEYFWSDRVFRNIEKREYIREKRREAGRAGANAKQNLANAKQCLANVSKGKEKKGKEKKGKEIKERKFIVPTSEEVTEYAKSISFVLDGSRFCDYYQSRGWLIGKSKIKDWRACVRTWKSKQSQTDENLKFLTKSMEKVGSGGVNN